MNSQPGHDGRAAESPDTPQAVRRIAVFIDWQNVHETARRAFGLGNLGEDRGNFSPYRLGQILAAGNGRGYEGSHLLRVEAHRGLPSQQHDAVGWAANRRQSRAWMDENSSVVVPRVRPLRYPPGYPDQPPVEKGIDVALAVSAVDWALRDRADVVIVFSHDSDLVPALELISRVKGAERVETASWSADDFTSRLLPKPPAGFHHLVTERTFRQVETKVNFAHDETCPGNLD